MSAYLFEFKTDQKGYVGMHFCISNVDAESSFRKLSKYGKVTIKLSSPKVDDVDVIGRSFPYSIIYDKLVFKVVEEFSLLKGASEVVIGVPPSKVESLKNDLLNALGAGGDCMIPISPDERIWLWAL